MFKKVSAWIAGASTVLLPVALCFADGEPTLNVDTSNTLNTLIANIQPFITPAISILAVVLGVVIGMRMLRRAGGK